jgi:uncharacterized membrane protein
MDKEKSPLKLLRRAFISGLVTMIPIGITFLSLQLIFRFLDGITGKYMRDLMPFYIPGLGIISTLLIIFLMGFVINNVVGKRIMEWIEVKLYKLPILGSIYNVSKQVVSLFQAKDSDRFKMVIYLEYPRKNIWTLGFVTARTHSQDGVPLYNVFVPTTPNPTSGYMVFIPRSDAVVTSYTIEEGLKLLISGGMVTPPQLSFTVNKSHQTKGTVSKNESITP